MTDAGEKMLTEERLAEIEKREPHIEVAGIVRGGYVIRELLDHITTLSTTIKRLETPVAEGEVEELGQLEKAATPGPWFRQDWGGEAYVCANDPDEPSRVKGIFGLAGEADCALTTALRNKALSICRRQAREIEQAAAGNGDPVRFYERDFYVLSNFSAFRVTMPTHFGEVDFDTSEHAYHYFKFPGEDVSHVRSMIRRAKSAHEAFKLAEQYRNDRRADWDTVKLDIMRGILRAKADQHEYVRRKLLATGNRQLVEDSWRDDYWGWGPNKDGQNMLGKLWMEVRAALSLNSVETREMKP